MRYLLLSVFGLAACAQPAQESDLESAPELVFEAEPVHILQSLCGNTYQGQVVSGDPQDEDWRKAGLTLGPVRCPAAEQFELPLAVGENTSRTWFITGRGDAIELRHQHLLEDGTVDPVSDYGGVIRGFPISVGSAVKMEFPADAKTIEIFTKNDLTVSNTNVWTLEMTPGQTLSYELNRENRHFRAEFNLATSQ